MVMMIADHLGKFEHEVLGLSLRELARWSAYLTWKKEQEKKAASRANRGRGRNPSSAGSKRQVARGGVRKIRTTE